MIPAIPNQILTSEQGTPSLRKTDPRQRQVTDAGLASIKASMSPSLIDETVRTNPDALVPLLNHFTSTQRGLVLISAAKYDRTAIIQLVLRKGVDSTYLHSTFKNAATRGHYNVVALLASRVTQTDLRQALHNATRNSHNGIVALLAPMVDSATHDQIVQNARYPRTIEPSRFAQERARCAHAAQAEENRISALLKLKLERVSSSAKTAAALQSSC